jgi:hypothetical protein
MLAVGLHPCRPSKRLIDTILPTRSRLLEVVKNIPIDAQRNVLFGARERRSLRSRFYGLRRCSLKRRFGRIPCGRGSSRSVGRHFMSSRWCPSGNILSQDTDHVVDLVVVTVSAGMKRSESGRGALINSPRCNASATTSGPISCRRSIARSTPLPRTPRHRCLRDSISRQPASRWQRRPVTEVNPSRRLFYLFNLEEHIPAGHLHGRTMIFLSTTEVIFGDGTSAIWASEGCLPGSESYLCQRL